MNPKLNRLGGWLYRRAEDILMAMLATMFFAFLIQILDAAILQAVPNGALDQRFCPPQEALAVDQTLAAGVQASIDNVHQSVIPPPSSGLFDPHIPFHQSPYLPLGIAA